MPPLTNDVTNEISRLRKKLQRPLNEALRIGFTARLAMLEANLVRNELELETDPIVVEDLRDKLAEIYARF